MLRPLQDGPPPAGPSAATPAPSQEAVHHRGGADAATAPRDRPRAETRQRLTSGSEVPPASEALHAPHVSGTPAAEAETAVEGRLRTLQEAELGVLVRLRVLTELLLGARPAHAAPLAADGLATADCEAPSAPGGLLVSLPFFAHAPHSPQGGAAGQGAVLGLRTAPAITSRSLRVPSAGFTAATRAHYSAIAALLSGQPLEDAHAHVDAAQASDTSLPSGGPAEPPVRGAIERESGETQEALGVSHRSSAVWPRNEIGRRRSAFLGALHYRPSLPPQRSYVTPSCGDTSCAAGCDAVATVSAGAVLGTNAEGKDRHAAASPRPLQDVHEVSDSSDGSLTSDAEADSGGGAVEATATDTAAPTSADRGTAAGAVTASITQSGASRSPRVLSAACACALPTRALTRTPSPPLVVEQDQPSLDPSRALRQSRPLSATPTSTLGDAEDEGLYFPTPPSKAPRCAPGNVDETDSCTKAPPPPPPPLGETRQRCGKGGSSQGGTSRPLTAAAKGSREVRQSTRTAPQHAAPAPPPRLARSSAGAVTATDILAAITALPPPPQSGSLHRGKGGIRLRPGSSKRPREEACGVGRQPKHCRSNSAGAVRVAAQPMDGLPSLGVDVCVAHAFAGGAVPAAKDLQVVDGNDDASAVRRGYVRTRQQRADDAAHTERLFAAVRATGKQPPRQVPPSPQRDPQHSDADETPRDADGPSRSASLSQQTPRQYWDINFP